ncbi:hypothetical protein ABLT40_06840 [Acinetobacter schindleri]|uniref:hypothetical protein n=1 Tax=Acinetobacter schindleri TaxID=108981 RepID=UPI0032B42A17
MVHEYIHKQGSLLLESDLGGEFPLYLYWSENRSCLLYSKSILDLLNDPRVTKPLKLSNEGISFLLQSGVVPPPRTIYQNIYIISIGDEAHISTENNNIQVRFSHKFPFKNTDRLPINEMQPNENLILEMLANATISRVNNSKPSFLFHSAGKDSNAIALALAEAGWQNKLTLITHKTKGSADESEISARIAKQLGFKHRVLFEVDQLETVHYDEISNYFFNTPFPCTDNVTLAYPLYLEQLPELRGSNIIDGGGNDAYMMIPPSSKELKFLPLSKLTSLVSFLRNSVNSESLLSPALRAPAEWCGMAGLSLKDALKIYPQLVDVYPYWVNESNVRRKWDWFDFKTDILTTITAAELHMRKARNFANVIDANLILPFTNQVIAEYFGKMPEEYLFDRKKLKNKLILRKILKERIGLDSDALGKMGFNYDTHTIIIQNWDKISGEIVECKLWSQPNVIKVITRLRVSMNGRNWSSRAAGRMIYRLYLISAWSNRNRYI